MKVSALNYSYHKHNCSTFEKRFEKRWKVLLFVKYSYTTASGMKYNNISYQFQILIITQTAICFSSRLIYFHIATQN